jgi:hypothetical protein
MDSSDMSFDPAGVRREFPSLPVTYVRSAVTEQLAHSCGSSGFLVA